jgi:hypothetical protein
MQFLRRWHSPSPSGEGDTSPYPTPSAPSVSHPHRQNPRSATVSIDYSARKPNHSKTFQGNCESPFKYAVHSFTLHVITPAYEHQCLLNSWLSAVKLPYLTEMKETPVVPCCRKFVTDGWYQTRLEVRHYLVRLQITSSSRALTFQSANMAMHISVDFCDIITYTMGISW